MLMAADIKTKIICYENGLLEFGEIVELFKELEETGYLVTMKKKIYFETWDYLHTNGYI